MKTTNIFIILLLLIGSISLRGQSDILSTKINLSLTNGTIQELLDHIEKKNSIIFAFDPNKVSVIRNVHLRNNSYVLEDLLNQFFIGQNIQYKPFRNKILLLPRQSNTIKLSGYIRSEVDRELLTGAIIYNNNTNQSYYTDESGYYQIKVYSDAINISVYYLGNIRQNMQLQCYKDSTINFYLKTDYNLDSVMIVDKYDPYVNINNSGEKVIDYVRKTFKGKLGQQDIYENLRMISGVQSGNEAQGGLYIRGGTPDQNLILYEGTPLYETSHLGGLSSIFLDDMIRNVNIIKGGFPARYGGKLSSVIDIKLKDGNPQKNNTILELGLDAMHFHMDGPIVNEKVTFNISLRKSLLNTTVSPLIKKLINYDRLDLNYLDGSFKIVFKPTKKQKLSLFGYSGSDKIGLNGRSNYSLTSSTFDFTDRSKIGWGTDLIGINYQNAITQKLSILIHLSALRYNRYTRGQYDFVKKDTVIHKKSIDILTYSGIDDKNSKIDIAYKLNNYNTIRFGSRYSVHSNNSSIHQSKTIIDSTITDIVKNDKRIITYDLDFYIEDKIDLSKRLSIYSGLRYNRFYTNNKSYHSIQPRFALNWHPYKGVTIIANASKMQQNNHFLVNPGLGLPSELWLSATDKIKPQTAIQYGLSASYFNSKMLRLGVDFNIKKYKSILEFDNPNDLFYAYILNESTLPLQNPRDWESHLEEGKAIVRSLEFYIFKKWEKWDLWAKYNWTKNIRTFTQLNNGIPFPHKFDRTNDLMLKAKFQINKKWTLTGTWTYGTGNTFTLPLNEYPDIDGYTIRSLDGRNNIRFPDYHHLDISTSYSTHLKNLKIRLSTGIYNVYNNANPFYIYLYKDETTNKLKLRQVSIFNFVPFINLRIVL